MKFEAIFFDLFNTLLHFDYSLLPKVEFEDQHFRTTSVEVYRRLKQEFRLGFSYERFLEEFLKSRQIVGKMRQQEQREFSSFRRFEILQELVGLGDNDAATLMVEVHMNEMSRIMYCPPGKKKVLGKLRGHPLILVSNFDHAATARQALQKFGLEECFTQIFISEEVGWCKPSERFFQVVREKSGFDLQRCLYVGDDPVADVYGGGIAGFQVAWLVEVDQRVSPLVSPRWILRNLSEILTILEHP